MRAVGGAISRRVLRPSRTRRRLRHDRGKLVDRGAGQSETGPRARPRREIRASPRGRRAAASRKCVKACSTGAGNSRHWRAERLALLRIEAVGPLNLQRARQFQRARQQPAMRAPAHKKIAMAVTGVEHRAVPELSFLFGRLEGKAFGISRPWRRRPSATGRPRRAAPSGRHIMAPKSISACARSPGRDVVGPKRGALGRRPPCPRRRASPAHESAKEPAGCCRRQASASD